MTKEQALEQLKINTGKEPLTISGSATRITDYFKALSIASEALEREIEQSIVYNWTSVQEKLPPKPQFGEVGYIVQEKNVCEPFSAYWDGDIWTDAENDVVDNVIAWTSLPKPYKRY